ncbi:hypothetical protein [Prescottella equi]|uniref:hypothetical protein n=1 Tax=Rhodococcus hoagii TaxID=43767 RepID=UPI00111C32F1|nr:hypothetical protein [Prescottella equi]
MLTIPTLGETGQQMWQHLAAEGMTTTARIYLTEACKMADQADAAAAAWRADGRLVLDHGAGKHVHPLLEQERSCWQSVRYLLSSYRAAL